MQKAPLAGRLLILLTASAALVGGCGLAADEDDTDASAIGRAATALRPSGSPRTPQAEAEAKLTAAACAEAFAAEGERAQARCRNAWPHLLAEASDEDDEDDEQAAARAVCAAEGVLDGRLEACKDAAVPYLLANKRGFSLGDLFTMRDFAAACAPATLCVDG